MNTRTMLMAATQMPLEGQLVQVIARIVVASRFSSTHSLPSAIVATLPQELDILHADAVDQKTPNLSSLHP